MLEQNNMTQTDREKIQNLIAKTEEYFEKQLTYISAGALGISLTLINNIVPFEDAYAIIWIVIGWVLLVATLLLNLSSHMISKCFLNKTLSELDNNYTFKCLKQKKRNRLIDYINWITIILLIIGISSFVTFVSINLFKKHQEKKNITLIQIRDSSFNNNSKTNNFRYGK